MKYRSIFFFSFFMILLSCSQLRAQDNFTISGTVKNSESGEALIGASILIKELPGTGASSNAYGFYSLTIPKGIYTLIVRYIGFKTKTDPLTLDNNRILNISIVPEAIRFKEVVVSGERNNDNVTSMDISKNKLEIRQIQAIPVILGEKDILKTIQLLPGIKSAGEGSTGFYARGGGIDQNLILLDEAPIYNSAHLLGFLSVFNSDAIKDVTVITGGLPAEYGGRLSSVLDIRTNDGNAKEYGGSGGIGLLTSRFLLQGPIVKDQGSFIISARRTYADLFLKLSSDTLINRTSLYFYDLNMKANYSVGERDRVFISGYFGRDNFNYPNAFGFNWGNATATARWNHIFGQSLFSNTSFIFSDYSYSNNVSTGINQFQITSGIRDFNVKFDFQYFISSMSNMKFGINSIYHTFLPGTVTTGSTTFTNTLSVPNKYAFENAAYFSHELEPITGIKVDYGFRLSMFNLMGPGTFYSYDASGFPTDTASYSSGKIVKTYSAFEPRVSANYILDESNSVKAAYTRTAQYLHLLSNSTTNNPSDLWVPSSNNVKPQYCDQYTIGYFRNFSDNEYEVSLELYYKNMLNLIDYKNGADLQLNPYVESLLLTGKGRSYGAEFLIRKKFGQFSGWIGYTLSKTQSIFDQINGGNPFNARQDRTHDISIVGIYELNPSWTFSATWVYNTGNAVTFPSGNYWVDGRLVPYYTERNGYRMPAYHRLDLAATWTLGLHSNLNFSIYNAYNRWNAYSILFRQDPKDPTKTQALQTTFFPFIPSVTYNFAF
jgi:CarboxypepD_reg-like domain/TonB dependent receptor/TonB-dependent Receptor Plug Domain